MNILQYKMSKNQSFCFFRELQHVVEHKRDFIAISEWILYAERYIDGKGLKDILDDDIEEDDGADEAMCMEGETEENTELNEMQKANNENKKLRLLSNMHDGSTVIFDSLPALEKELAAYENQIRQDTSKLAKRFKSSYWRIDDFPDSFYNSVLQLLETYDFKSPSFSRDNRKKLLHGFINRCMGIPIASMLLPVLLTLFISRGYKEDQSIYSMLKPRNIKVGQKEQSCLEELFFLIRTLVSESIKEKMPWILRKFLVPVFNENAVIDDALEQYCIADDDLRKKMVEYYQTYRKGLKLKANNDTLTGEQKEIVEQLAKVYSMNTYLLVMGDVEPSSNTIKAIRNLNEKGLLLISPQKVIIPFLRGESQRDLILKGSHYPVQKRCDPENWMCAMRQMYEKMILFGYMVEHDYNDIEFLRCFNLPLDFKCHTLPPDIAELCKIAERVSDKACGRILEEYRRFMRRFVSKEGIDLYLAKQLEESKVLAGKIAHHFGEEDYISLINSFSMDKEKEMPLWFRDFLLDFFNRKNITPPAAYSTHQMEVELECLQTMLSLCTIFARSSLVNLYNELYTEKLRKKRTT